MLPAQIVLQALLHEKFNQTAEEFFQAAGLKKLVFDSAGPVIEILGEMSDFNAYRLPRGGQIAMFSELFLRVLRHLLRLACPRHHRPSGGPLRIREMQSFSYLVY